FTTQDQNPPDEYFIATPRLSSRKDIGKNSDIENGDEIIIPRKKEDKINSLKNVLLRQSLTDSSVYNQTNDRLYNGNQLRETNTVIAERVRLMTIKQQLAKEAASTSQSGVALRSQLSFISYISQLFDNHSLETHPDQLNLVLVQPLRPCTSRTIYETLIYNEKKSVLLFLNSFDVTDT
ncbi:unnamed protein product, partial [Schistosoma curassoni]|uniref:Uncharacterized protein n=1 Tax=Schistosoma curassoni TaxID=6186 RepID=A0A183KPJ3_9TREM